MDRPISHYTNSKIHNFPQLPIWLRFRADLKLTDQQKIRIGAAAWSFQEWRGGFYPAELPESEWLEFYGRYLPAVEIDSTFYSIAGGKCHPPLGRGNAVFVSFQL